MSYMGQAAFMPASGIQELNFDEIGAADGGILPLLAIAYVGIGLSSGVLIAGGGFLAGVALYDALH
ncbi:MAG: hypothetical protein WC692_12845 [Erythrobacter sp.]